MSQAIETQKPTVQQEVEGAGDLVPFLPENVNQAWRLAMSLSKSQLVPSKLQGKPYDLLATLITGRELGLSPMQSIRGMHVIEGKAVMSSELMVALVVSKADICEVFQVVETNEKLATYSTKRRGYDKPTTMTFSMEDATRAGLTGKDNWKKYPAAMLRARCSSALCRAVYPDLVGGVYEADEAEEITGRAPASVVELRPAAGGSRLDQLNSRLARTDTGDSVDVATGEVIDADTGDGFDDGVTGNAGGQPNAEAVTTAAGAANISEETKGPAAPAASSAPATGRRRF